MTNSVYSAKSILERERELEARRGNIENYSARQVQLYQECAEAVATRRERIALAFIASGQYKSRDKEYLRVIIRDAESILDDMGVE